MQFLGLASVAAIVGVAGVGAASTLRGERAAAVTTSGGNVAAESKPDAEPKAPARNPAAVVLQSAPAVSTPAPGTPAATPAPRPATRGGYVLVEGRTKLTDSVYAIRTGDSVVVNFDAYGYRTRRSAKFEASLRQTLPMLFGRTATASIDTVDTGALVTNRDLVGTLAGEGMRVTLDNGATVRIKAITRLVTDGPIAIGYLTIIER